MKVDSKIIAEPLLQRSDRSLEIELLIACSRTQITPIQQERIQILVRDRLDWDYLIWKATEHNILPLLDRQLQNIDVSEIPPTVLAEMRDNFTDNFQNNLRLTVELLKLSRLFADRSIPMMSFKGAILAQLAYGNLGLRQFLDIDILVPEADVVRTSQLLLDLGYEPQFALTEKQQTVYTGLRSEHCFWHEAKQICVDLHWSILPKHYSFTPVADLLWSKIEPFDFAEQSVSTLCPEHLFLFLCAHGAKHNWSKLAWIVDLAELLKLDRSLDWEEMQNLAGQFGTQRMLLLGLYLAHQLLGASLPESILAQFVLDPTLPTLTAQIQENLFQSATINIDPTTDATILDRERDAIYRTTMGSSRDRIWYWIDIILTPTPLEWEIVALPQWLFPVYYLIRSIRLAIKYAGNGKRSVSPISSQ
jgi:Uncharacterised nucleotidyltransferase